MKTIAFLVFCVSVAACGVIPDEKHHGHQATSYQSIHMEHFHPVPTYVKKEDMHYLEHPISEGKTESKVEVHHGSKHEPGYAVANLHSESHGHEIKNHFIASGGHEQEEHHVEMPKHYEHEAPKHYEHEAPKHYVQEEPQHSYGHSEEQSREEEGGHHQYNYESDTSEAEGGEGGDEGTHYYHGEEDQGSYEQHSQEHY